MRNFIQDLRYGMRLMTKRPGFAIVAALTLALGIGANTSIFSAVNAMPLKPLPFPESQQLVDLSETFKSNQRPVAVSSSKLLDELAQRKKTQPAITSKELAAVANELLEKRGFDFMFNVCDALHMRKSTDSVANYEWSLTSGEKRTFKLNVASSDDALCGECGQSMLPSVQVTKQEMVLVAEGKRYRVRRPVSFDLDEVELVDATMKKVLRTWQLPYETVPVGISADGTKLYLDFWTQYELDGLVLELSENGSLAFRDRSESHMVEGKLIEDHPRDPNNSYLTFIRFNAGAKTYIIRFSAPCT